MNRVKDALIVFMAVGLLVGACTSGGGNKTTTSGAVAGQQGGTGGCSASGCTLDRIKKTGEMRACIDPEFPPEVYLDKQNQPAGLDVDLTKAVGEALGVKVTFVQTNFDGLIAGLQSNKCDISLSGMTPRGKRALSITFAKDTIVATVGVVVNQKETRTTIDQLNQPSFRFCDQANTGAQIAQETYFPKATATNLPSEDACLLQVLSGKADANISDSTTGHGYVKAHPQLKLILFDNGGLAAAPTAPGVQLGDYGFKFYLDVFFREFIDNGDYAPLFEKDLGFAPDIQQLLIQRGGL